MQRLRVVKNLQQQFVIKTANVELPRYAVCRANQMTNIWQLKARITNSNYLEHLSRIAGANYR